ncbi:hypothetical protein GIB67_035057 [Kingdonia uniflora]|uniref:BZIP domain-containing protein n=1 Tax=Kingdonia uniflora TaxID=39325 RepID=A0A7J7L1Q0_9MAGN|nr:hypothetical protein GIB67_035057 [Kingdonia uniflora]
MGIQTMGSNNKSFPPSSPLLTRQGSSSSMYSLTLDQVQTHLGGEPLNSMNLDQLLQTIWDNQQLDQTSSSIDRQGSFSLDRDFSKKTVDEVWRDIQQQQQGIPKEEEEPKPPNTQTTLGEMTLEDFLVKAGIVPSDKQQQPPQTQTHTQTSMMGAAFGVVDGHQSLLVGATPLLETTYSDNQMTVSTSPMMGSLLDKQRPGRKRSAPGDMIEKTVERRQKRMIKNRESAARSRARKQAYTNELENKVSRLEEENGKLLKQKVRFYPPLLLHVLPLLFIEEFH